MPEFRCRIYPEHFPVAIKVNRAARQLLGSGGAAKGDTDNNRKKNPHIIILSIARQNLNSLLAGPRSLRRLKIIL